MSEAQKNDGEWDNFLIPPPLTTQLLEPNKTQEPTVPSNTPIGKEKERKKLNEVDDDKMKIEC